MYVLRGDNCSDAAILAAQPINDQLDKLYQSWRPTGYYTVDSLITARDKTIAVLTQTSTLVEAARKDWNFQITLAMYRAMGDMVYSQVGKSLAYTHAIQTAQGSGAAIIDAPGFASWVVGSLALAASVTRDVAYSTCERPWTFDVLRGLTGASMELVSAVQGIGSATAAAGQAVIKVLANLDKVVKVLEWGALALASGYVLLKIHRWVRDDY